MKRSFTIRLEECQISDLKVVSKKHRVNVSEIIRVAIDEKVVQLKRRSPAISAAVKWTPKGANND